MLLLATGTFVLMSLIFAPHAVWPLSFVCLVPWLVLVGTARSARRAYMYTYVLGAAFFFWNMRWMYHATGVGYAALSLYLAVYFPLTACPIRHAVRRRLWPLGVVVPLVWTGSEMVRAVALSGFPWFFLAHSHYKVLTLIQVSDLVGAYGVGFVVAAVNGAVADVVLAVIASRRAPAPERCRGLARISVAFAGVLLVAVCVYGRVRLHRETAREGPRIAILQGDFINLVDMYDGNLTAEAMRRKFLSDERKKKDIYLSMMQAAANTEPKPDLYLLPESPWQMRLNQGGRVSRLSVESFAELQDHATAHDGYVVTGSGSVEYTPNDLLAKERRYNSAMVFYPDGREPDRYDKVHLVYFGEIVPFRFGTLRFVYLWLNKLMPFSDGGRFEYSLFRGREFRVFSMSAASRGGEVFRFGIPICYEDVMPYVSRAFVLGPDGRKRADMLLNISNDGWFGHGNQQAQHLAISVFRAVENRVALARAVNTGDSALIEPTGRLHDAVSHDPSSSWPGETGYAVGSVGVDPRLTAYTRYGDWFGWTCAVFWMILYIDYLIVRARSQGIRPARGQDATG